MKRLPVRAGLLGLCACVLLPAAHAAQRTFVSTSGSDSNACSLVAPCRGFAKAITVTDPGGELVVLDSGGYGFVTVNKNVTILSPAGVYAGISVFAAQDGITVSAPATKVVLRGLTINGQGGNHGIRVQAGEVHVESTVISNMTQAGILVEGGSTVRISGTVSRSNLDGLRIAPAAGSVSVLVRDSEFSHNTTAGIGVSPSAVGANAQVTVERSSATKNGAGVVVGPGASASATVVVMQSVTSENTGAGVSSIGTTATVYVRESAITRNGTGLAQSASGVLNACGANLLVANTLAQSGAINTASCLDVAAASGTVISVGSGTGLTGGPITSSGTLSIANLGVGTAELANAAVTKPKLAAAGGSSGQVLGTDGTNLQWQAAGGGGTVTSVGSGTGLTGGPITTTGTLSADTTYLQRRVSTTCAVGSSIRTIAADGSVTCQTDNTGPANAFVQGGNAFGAAGVLGTSDSFALDIRVNNSRVMRYEPDATSPNIVGGHPSNTSAGVGNTVSGGGTAGNNCYEPTTVLLNRSCANRATNNHAAVAGGYSNFATGNSASVSGGVGNTASGNQSSVAGGAYNIASGGYSAIGSGLFNIASGGSSFAAGGQKNLAGGDYSFVAGYRAKVRDPIQSGDSNGDEGSFVWADTQEWDFFSAGPNEFAARATGGVRFVTAIDGSGNPTRTVKINGNGELDFGSDVRQMLNLYGPAAFGIGVQAHTLYFRSNPGVFGTNGGFSWYRGGSHNDNINDAGGGFEVMRLASNGTLYVIGGAVAPLSDRAAKQEFATVDPASVLDKLVRMPISSWVYKANPSVRHIGPTAQDFRAAFALGDDDERSIATVDADGVALAAIQGLHAELKARDATIAAQQARLDQHERELEALSELLRGLRAELRLDTTVAHAGTRPD